MGIYLEYFAASSDEVAAAVLDTGPAGATPAVPMVDLKGVEPVAVMGSLESLLTGREYEEVVENPRHGYAVADHDDGVWVVALTQELRDALASSADDEVRIAVSALAMMPELVLGDAEDVAWVVEGLKELAALARTAKSRGDGLYCWMSV